MDISVIGSRLQRLQVPCHFLNGLWIDDVLNLTRIIYRNILIHTNHEEEIQDCPVALIKFLCDGNTFRSKFHNLIPAILDHTHAIEFLKRDRAGRATFLPLNKMRRPIQLKEIKEKGVIVNKVVIPYPHENLAKNLL